MIEPTIGMGATYIASETEMLAGTIIDVSASQKRLVWQKDETILVRDPKNTFFEFYRNENGDTYTFSLRGTGVWLRTGFSSTGKSKILLIGQRKGYSPSIEGIKVPDVPEPMVSANINQGETWWGIDELKTHLKCSAPTIYRMIRCKNIPAPYKIGKLSRWNAKEVDQFILKNCRTGYLAQLQDEIPKKNKFKEN